MGKTLRRLSSNKINCIKSTFARRLLYSFRNDFFQQEGFLAIGTLRFPLIGNHKQTATFGTRLFERPLPGGEITIRIIFAAEKRPSLTGFSLHEFPPILRAQNAYFFQPGLCVATGWEVGTRNEFSKTPITNNKLAAILRALTTDWFRLALCDGHFCLRFFDILGKRAIELMHHFHPLRLTGGDHIEILFHASSEL